jgi:indolepyruvate ferredoxin oxidoreductase
MSIAVRKRGAGSGRSASDGQRFRRSGDGDGGGRRRGTLRDISLDDKYVLEEGRILLTGLQGLVRLPLDQHRADRRRGLHTGTMISGYQGSPLGGLDKELAPNRELVE